MQLILLSGGSGKRLWPLSNDVRSKQFIPLFQMSDGKLVSMVQRVYGQIRHALGDVSVTVATSRSQVATLRKQLPAGVDLSVEPCRRDTFPAMALAAAYLSEVKHISPREPVVVCPIDPYVQDDYFVALGQLADLAAESDANLVLMGIEPTYPSEKYGYIVPESRLPISSVLSFKEKPASQAAAAYIEKGALWNSGVFAFRLGYLLSLADSALGSSSYRILKKQYAVLPKISFDYAVVEQEKKIEVMRYRGAWSDLGTWNTLTDVMGTKTIGRTVLGDACKNTYVVNELDVPVLCMGMNDVVVAASPEGILVTDRRASAKIKPYVEKFDQPVMFADKTWGHYRVIDVGKRSLTVKALLGTGHRMTYHSHQLRDEVWIVVAGEGMVTCDGKKRKVSPGDVVNLPRGCKHTMEALTEMEIIEVQCGDVIDVRDKEKWSEGKPTEKMIKGTEAYVCDQERWRDGEQDVPPAERSGRASASTGQGAEYLDE